jgi:DNA-binding PadR family transcriptional regulator
MDFKEGTMYPVLHKLEKKGLIESFWKASYTGRKRKYYRITNKGKKELHQEKENWNTVNNIITLLWKTEPKLTYTNL